VLGQGLLQGPDHRRVVPGTASELEQCRRLPQQRLRNQLVVGVELPAALHRLVAVLHAFLVLLEAIQVNGQPSASRAARGVDWGEGARRRRRRTRGDLSHEEVGGGAVGEEGDVTGVEQRAAGVVVDGRLEEELAVGVVASLLGAPRLLLPLARFHLAPHSGPSGWTALQRPRKLLMNYLTWCWFHEIWQLYPLLLFGLIMSATLFFLIRH
jgi:hypothetical protein